jgi:hypothetical protein
MTTKKNKKTYSVRRPGCAAWEGGLTLAAARKSCREANRVCTPGHIITED